MLTRPVERHVRDLLGLVVAFGPRLRDDRGSAACQTFGFGCSGLERLALSARMPAPAAHGRRSAGVCAARGQGGLSRRRSGGDGAAHIATTPARIVRGASPPKMAAEVW